MSNAETISHCCKQARVTVALSRSATVSFVLLLVILFCGLLIWVIGFVNPEELVWTTSASRFLTHCALWLSLISVESLIAHRIVNQYAPVSWKIPAQIPKVPLSPLQCLIRYPVDPYLRALNGPPLTAQQWMALAARHAQKHDTSSSRSWLHVKKMAKNGEFSPEELLANGNIIGQDIMRAHATSGVFSDKQLLNNPSLFGIHWLLKLDDGEFAKRNIDLLIRHWNTYVIKHAFEFIRSNAYTDEERMGLLSVKMYINKACHTTQGGVCIALENSDYNGSEPGILVFKSYQLNYQIDVRTIDNIVRLNDALLINGHPAPFDIGCDESDWKTIDPLIDRLNKLSILVTDERIAAERHLRTEDTVSNTSAYSTTRSDGLSPWAAVALGVAVGITLSD